MMRTLLAMGVVALLTSGISAMQPDDIIARIGDRSIRYREIRCDRMWIDAMRRARNDVRTTDAACHDVEQARLDLLMRNELLARAAEVASIEVTAEEIAAQELPIVKDEAELARFIEHSQAMPRAIARVRNGEDPDVVYAERLAPLGIPRETFDSVSRVFDTKEKVDAYLAQDPRERTLNALRHNAKLAAISARIAALHSDEAARTSRHIEDVRTDFWKHVVASTRTVVVQDNYRLPELKDLP